MTELMHNTQRWLIPDSQERLDRKDYWVAAHGERQYADVFSVSEDDSVRARIVGAALRSPVCRQILIAGCGSRVALQRDLIAQAGNDATITATDYRAVVDLARARFSHPRLNYVALEERARFERRFDAVIAVNVLVSDSDSENRRLLAEWSDSLVHNGRLVILLPILSSGYELGTLGERPDLLECLDGPTSRWTEKHQGIVEIEYLPLRLRRMLKEVGLKLIELSIVFFEGAESRRQTFTHYGIDDDDLLVYEQLAIAVRH